MEDNVLKTFSSLSRSEAAPLCKSIIAPLKSPPQFSTIPPKFISSNATFSLLAISAKTRFIEVMFIFLNSTFTQTSLSLAIFGFQASFAIKRMG